MKLFVVTLFTIGVFVFCISMSIGIITMLIDDTEIGKAIRDHILSKITKEKKSKYQEQVDEVMGKDIVNKFFESVGMNNEHTRNNRKF